MCPPREAGLAFPADRYSQRRAAAVLRLTVRPQLEEPSDAAQGEGTTTAGGTSLHNEPKLGNLQRLEYAAALKAPNAVALV